jgi:glycosyltransferase involved in cell wall biosynthesis
VTVGPVLLYGSRRPLDQFAGVPERLREAGLEVWYERLWGDAMRQGTHALPWLIERAGVVAFADLTHSMHTPATLAARRAGTPTVLLVDGVTEFANVLMNPWLGPTHLRPASQDAVLALGPLQAAILRALGNEPTVSGLPRLEGFADRVRDRRASLAEAPGALIVSTANTPAMTEPARARLLRSLELIRAAAARAGVPVAWRLTGDLATTLGVEADGRPLDLALAGAKAVLTTASTLAVESMLTGVPTGVFHPHPWPLWVPGAWTWSPRFNDIDADADAARAAAERGAAASGAAEETIAAALNGVDPQIRPAPPERQAEELLESLLAPDADRLRVQGELLEITHTPDAAAIVAGSLARTAGGEHPAPRQAAPRPVETLARTSITAGPKRARRVLSLLQCGRSPVGGVTNWSVRMGRAFAARPDLGFEFHTLAIAAEPLNFERANIPEDPSDPFLHACVLDPCGATHERIEAITAAARALEPDLVIPSYNDETFAAAAALHDTGARVLAIAHVEETADEDRLRDFDRWDAGVGVSDACTAWIARAAGGRPIDRIVYGVPVRPQPRPAAGDGPIRLAYIGRMVEWQKRISDLLRLLERLEELGTDYRLDVVGDGPDMRAWLARLEAMGLRDHRVFVHGRRDMHWVESFLPTVDMSVIVSGWEGTSISMLEAMGQGVAPCVTRVNSGVGEWVDDGVHGVVVPVGQPDRMADRIDELARDRTRVAAMGEAARQRMLGRGMDTLTMAERYASVFRRTLSAPQASTVPRDDAVRLRDRSVWTPRIPAQESDADGWFAERLRTAGFRSIAVGDPTPGCDAVLVPASAPRPSESAVEAWRRRGLGVAVSPNGASEGAVRLAEAAVRRLVDGGCARIAVFGAGEQSGAFVPPVRHGAPIVGWIDDGVRGNTTHMGLPAVPFERFHELHADGVILNSQRFEPLMAARLSATPGVRLAALTRDDRTLRACIAAVEAIRAIASVGGRVLLVHDPETAAYAAALNASETVSPGMLARRVGQDPVPDAIALAIVSDPPNAREALGPWLRSGVPVHDCLATACSADASADEVQQAPCEPVEPEPFAAPLADRP